MPDHDWKIYHGTGKPPEGDPPVIPHAPPWRTYEGEPPEHDRDIPRDVEPEGEKFFAVPELVEAVNAALYLRRPLLLTGRPGSGKSMVIRSVARELALGPVLEWHVTSASTLKDALYGYDAVGRLQDKGFDDPDAPRDIGRYLSLGPLGTALLPTKRPRALLIDEIDKADIDLPNDLLNVFERGEFIIPELKRLSGSHDIPEHESDRRVTIQSGKVACHEFPFVVLTSNGERDFPAAFLRRCIRFRMPAPEYALLKQIVTNHLGADAAQKCDDLIRSFSTRAEDNRALATDQLMNAVFVVTRQVAPESEERRRVLDLLERELIADRS